MKLGWRGGRGTEGNWKEIVVGRHKHYTLYKCMEFSKSKNIIKMIINKNTMAVMQRLWY